MSSSLRLRLKLLIFSIGVLCYSCGSDSGGSSSKNKKRISPSGGGVVTSPCPSELQIKGVQTPFLGNVDGFSFVRVDTQDASSFLDLVTKNFYPIDKMHNDSELSPNLSAKCDEEVNNLFQEGGSGYSVIGSKFTTIDSANCRWDVINCNSGSSSGYYVSTFSTIPLDLKFEDFINKAECNTSSITIDIENSSDNCTLFSSENWAECFLDPLSDVLDWNSQNGVLNGGFSSGVEVAIYIDGKVVNVKTWPELLRTPVKGRISFAGCP